MDNIMSLFEFTSDGKRKMGRPPKVAPFSHYEQYKPADVEFFISLIAGREDLYNPCDEFGEERIRAFYFLEKKCAHFLAMRKGRNAEKLWLYLFNDFEKEYRNRTRSNNAKPVAFTFYRYMDFLIPYLECCERREKGINTLGNANAFLMSLQAKINEPTVDDEEPTMVAKRPKMESSEQDDWFMKVLETVSKPDYSTKESSPPSVAIKSEAEPSTSSSISSSSSSVVTPSKPSDEKHADIVTFLTSYLDEVPNEKLMICKVRLFQFIENEKTKLKEGGKITL